MPQILIVEDNQEIVRLFLRELGEYQVDVASTGKEALSKAGIKIFNAVLLDLFLPDSNDLEILREIKKIQPQCPVIVMTGYGNVPLAVSAIKIGAYDFIEKPFRLVAIKKLLKNAIGSSQSNSHELHREIIAIADQVGFKGFRSREIQDLLLTAYKIAKKNLNVLICGETGAGKEVLARFIHAASNRAHEGFFPINCGGLAENLLDSELFGHEKGAFTGAASKRRGYFEIADKGTIFLDEIGDASPGLQAKLLRILETGEFQRVGGESYLTVDTRVLAATNVDLGKAVMKNLFREDLYFRLSAVCLNMPPLRVRKDDILDLTSLFLKRTTYPENAPVLSSEAAQIFLNYPWPGNVRELYNVTQQTTALHEERMILPEHLPAHLTSNAYELAQLAATIQKENERPLSLHEYERIAITSAIRYCKGNIQEASNILGIARATLYRKINELSIKVDNTYSQI